MACCHNVMLLLDTAGGAAGQSPVRRAALRLLTYLSCRFGLARVRWAFRFFDSQGARSRPSRVSDFRELGVRSWEDFEEELETRLREGARGAHLPGPAPRATHTHSALMETLLDYQWDRPEITSPTKPILRSSGRRLLDVESEAREAESALGSFVNAVFLLAPCPHSQRELLQFVSGCEVQAQGLPPTPKQVMEKLLPKRVQEVMIARKITLYWVDTTEWSKVTDLLRMVYLTEDSAYLAKFLEEILGLYIDSIPKTLGNLYNSLGFAIPQKLAAVLPTDFFSDDAMTQESKSPLSVPLTSSAHRSASGGTESDQLEEIRTRSAKKRRYSQTPLRGAASGVPREAAFVGTPPNQKGQLLCGPGASQAEELAQKWKDAAIRTPERSGNTTLTCSPPISTENSITSPLCGISRKSPFGKFSRESPSPGELDWKEARQSSSVATSPSCPAPSTPLKASQIAKSDPRPPPPPSKIGKRHRKTTDPERSFLEGQPNSSAAWRVAVTDNPVAVTDTRKNRKEVTLSPERHSYPATGFASDWCTSPPLLIAGDSEYLTLLDEAERHGGDNFSSNTSPVEEGEGSGTLAADEKPSLCNPGIPPSSPSSEPCSPWTPSYDLRCTADRRQRQAAAQLENLQASTWLSEASASPQTYEVELEMQASGLPKLRIKKIDPSPLSEAEPLQREESFLGEESSLRGLGMPRASKSSGKPEATYLSPPCLCPSHSTPGKSGGQTYICQSCTPTRCPSSTPSPFQTDVGVPWTPSPKHSGKTTPDTIKDWPRRKRAVDRSLGSSAGRSEVSTELPGAVSLLELEGKERGLELSITKTAILGDFELEGVCQLPDQSPPRDSVPKAEEAFFWGQSGLGSRKRLLSAKEEAECQAKRVCDKQRVDSEVSRSEERSPGTGVRQLPSVADDEVFVSGATPPPGCAMRSCLSASGLQALTHSPLLFQGKTPSQYKDARDEDVDVFPPTTEDSPFSRAFSRRRPISRTYTRKKLIS
ncbi:hypothetical protein CB1_001815015 [Camelus ferus]|nr:hypothetical protein CB1_001815015 [Camelus ferus]